MTKTRVEIDPLGEKEIPETAYYGIQTMRATENFPVSGIKAPRVFIEAYVMVKKAAALANAEGGWTKKLRRRLSKHATRFSRVSFWISLLLMFSKLALAHHLT